MEKGLESWICSPLRFLLFRKGSFEISQNSWLFPQRSKVVDFQGKFCFHSGDLMAGMASGVRSSGF